MPNKENYFLTQILKPLSAWGILVLIDQATKYAIRNSFYLGESRQVAPFFQLTYLTNTGIAFSMFQGANTFFMVFTILVIAGFAVWYAVNAANLDRLIKTALVLVVSGAAGNLIDRLAFGQITDFLDVFVGSYHWPSFNVADSCISVGGVLIFIWAVRPASPKKK